MPYTPIKLPTYGIFITIITAIVSITTHVANTPTAIATEDSTFNNTNMAVRAATRAKPFNQ